MEDAIATKPFGILKNEGWNGKVEDIKGVLQNLKINPFANAIWENKPTAALHDLGIADKCHSLVINSDLATKMVDYFIKEHPSSHSVRWNLKICGHGFDCVCRVPINSCWMMC